MSNAPTKSLPPDQDQRNRALDPSRSMLVQAPAGSGKTTLLTERFLSLLAEVDEPGQVVAITFTNAAAAEMRNRILDELRKDQTSPLALRALDRSNARGWKLLDLPAQLRISTIDSFCRELALQQPLLSSLGGGLEIADQPDELYRRAARRTLEEIDRADMALSEAVKLLLLWRDNNWQEMEALIVEMLKNRDRWMQDFVLESEQDIEALRARLERPFALAAIRGVAASGYTNDEWKIVKACFILLRRAAAHLRVVFAETGRVDFIEVAQMAQNVLQDTDGFPTDAALAVADGIRHILVDEFQDTSRRQYKLLAGIIAAWPERTGRSCFAVGDPMQSIYFFREADVELFACVKADGLEIPQNEPLLFNFVTLSANFRTQPALINRLNEVFEHIFAVDDGSGVNFSRALPFRDDEAGSHPYFKLHLDFVPRTGPGKSADPEAVREKEAAREAQNLEIVKLIRNHWESVELARANEGKYRIAILARARKSLAPIALALREAGIPFRAVELENLKDRPEVLDALSLARALLNSYDRVAWLGVLRAPWCGLALEDLHRLTSADDPELLARPVPELLAERLQFLSVEGQRAASRVLDMWNSMPALRAARPTATTGTWLQQVWQRLGGGACVDATASANVDLLWSCLDGLPAGEQDLVGLALDAALDKLTALPNPEAKSDCGVQLMTIHKSKGLEFEVVIVPDLQARTRNNKPAMLSWLERGLTQPDSRGEITEFLIAPFQPQGKERGKAKVWVDSVIRERETQEDRRILYTAATRAREELHLFARPEYKIENNRQFNLSDPAKNSLLATAWPALEEEVGKQFKEWKTARETSDAGKAQVIETIAASENNLLLMPSPAKPMLLRRLPLDYHVAACESDGAPEPVLSLAKSLASETREGTLYTRHEGGMLSRALGSAVHTLLEELARLRTLHEWAPARAALTRLKPRIAAQARATGLDPAQAAGIATKAMETALSASSDPMGQWILSPRTEAASEVSWAGVVSGGPSTIRTVRVDRIFRAGLAPGTEGEDCWWIVDYKTAHDENANPAEALPALRKIFAPQLEAYAAVLRNLRGADTPICAGLYYPRMLLLDWWQL